MKASIKWDEREWVAQLHDHDIAAQGKTRDEALHMLRVCFVGHGTLGSLPLPTPSRILKDFGGEVVEL